MATKIKKAKMIKCKFKCNVVKYDKKKPESLLLENSKLRTYNNIDVFSNYLYVFDANFNLYKKITTKPVFDNNGYKYDCDFERRKTYYCFFSGRELLESELVFETSEQKKKLIKIKADTIVRIEHSFLVWTAMLESFKAEINGGDNNNLVTNLFNKDENFGFAASSDGLKILEWIRKNRYLILADNTVFDAKLFFDSIKQTFSSESSLLWKIKYEELVQFSLADYEAANKRKSYFKIWRDKAPNIINPFSLTGCLFGFSYCKENVSDLTGGDFVLKIKNFFLDSERNTKMNSHYMDSFAGQSYLSYLDATAAGKALNYQTKFYFENITRYPVKLKSNIDGFYLDQTSGPNFHVVQVKGKIRAIIFSEKISEGILVTDNYYVCNVSAYNEDGIINVVESGEVKIDLDKFDVHDIDEVQKHVDYVMEELVAVSDKFITGVSTKEKELEKTLSREKFVFVVERAREVYGDIWFKNKIVQSHALAAITKNLATEFAWNHPERPVTYDHDTIITSNGKYSNFDSGIDCISFVLTGVYILGHINQNIHYQDNIINGVPNHEGDIIKKLESLYPEENDSQIIPWKINTDTRDYCKYEYNGKIYFMYKKNDDNVFCTPTYSESGEERPIQLTPIGMTLEEQLNIVKNGKLLKVYKWPYAKEYFSNGVRNTLGCPFKLFEDVKPENFETLENKDKIGLIGYIQKDPDKKMVKAFDKNGGFREFRMDYYSHVFILLKNNMRAHSTTGNAYGLVINEFTKNSKKRTKRYARLSLKK